MAAVLSAGFLRDITENIALAGGEAPISGYVAYAPAGSEALFDGMLADGHASRSGRRCRHVARPVFGALADLCCMRRKRCSPEAMMRSAC